MLAIQPIREPDVTALLNAGRFEGEIEGYVVMEDERYHGYALYRLEGERADLLDSGIEDAAILDGALRACLAACENRGASRFCANMGHPPLAAWWQRHCTGQASPMPIAALWGACGH